MTNPYEKLDEAFNTESEIVSSSDNPAEILPPQEGVDIEIFHKKDSKTDYNYVRGNLYSIIEKGQEAINGVLELAQETESPRAYEVFGQLVKNVSDTTDKLIDLQKKMKELEDPGKISSPTTVNNTLFVGSTAELSKMLKSQLKELNDK